VVHVAGLSAAPLSHMVLRARADVVPQGSVDFDPALFGYVAPRTFRLVQRLFKEVSTGTVATLARFFKTSWRPDPADATARNPRR